MARPTLAGHRKFRRLVRLLGTAIIARGVLELLWDPCYESGDDYLGTAADIEERVGWSSEVPGALAVALVEVGAPEGHGFIEVVTPSEDPARVTYRVHDLWHHAPDYVQKRRSRELARKDKVGPSSEQRRTAPNGGHCPPTSDSQIELDRTPAPAPAPALAPALAPAHAHPPPADVSGLAENVGGVWTPEAPAPSQGALIVTDDGFAAFWAEYPRKVDKAGARKAWKALRPDAALQVRILTALRRHRATRSWQEAARTDPELRHIPHAETWLHRRRFEDELAPQETARAFASQQVIRRRPDDGWFEECQRLHDGTCGGRVKHATRMDIDATRSA